MSTVPGLLRSYADALLRPRRRHLRDDEALPDLSLQMSGTAMDPAHVERYRELCGFGAHGGVPITYPMVFTLPLQLALLTHPAWPLRAAGLIHLGVTLRWHLALAPTDAYSASCRVAGLRRTRRGDEFDLYAALYAADGRLAWEGTSAILSRYRRQGPARDPLEVRTADADPECPDEVGVFDAPSIIGLRYARLSGDWNPIHWGAIGARLAGFRRPLAHGMWTLARTLATAGDGGDAPGVAVSAAFRAPLFLPGRVTVRAGQEVPATRVLQAYDTGGRLLLTVRQGDAAPA